MDIDSYYIEKGSGRPLILLHGNSGSSSYFVKQIDEFSRYFRVFAVDTRGHGRTERGKGPFTIRRFADDLCAFIEEKKIGRSSVLGFSDGANIAMAFAVKYPHLVDRLVLNGANLRPSGLRMCLRIPAGIGYRAAGIFAGKMPEARAFRERMGLIVNEPDLDSSELSAIDARTLVIAGTRDIILRKHTKLIADSIPDSELVIMRGNHFIAHRRSGMFNRIVLEFLRG